MDRTHDKRTSLWVATTLAIGILAASAAAWGFNERRSREHAGLELEAQYQAAFHSMLEHIENVELLLSKSLVSATPARQALTLTRVHAEANAAQEALSRLPVSLDLQRSQQFLAQLGDFSYVMAERIAAGQAPKPDDWTTLARLKSQTGAWMVELNELRRQAMNGRFEWSRPRRQQASVAAAIFPAPPDDGEDVVHHLAELDRELQETPSLIYDGPFSEQNLRPRPKTALGRTVTQQQAARAAVDFVTRGQPAASRRWRAVPRDSSEGPIPTFAFEIRPDDSGEAGTGGPNREQKPIYIEVSRQGGRVIWFLVYETPSASNDVSIEEAQNTAQNYLRRRGFHDFVPTGWVRQAGQVTFSFARTEKTRYGTVVIYPELIKITVSANGQDVTGFDARAYWLNRQPDRSFPAPSEQVLTRSDVEHLVNPLLKVVEVRPAVIPLPSGSEAFVYEVLASLAEDRFLLYYNVTTGREEMILRLVETENSRLTY